MIGGVAPGYIGRMPPPPHATEALRATIAICSNKGGVGKTTLATNLAIYFRALREDLPVLLIGLDDQRVIDRMFGLHGEGKSRENLKHAWAERSFSRVARLGEYGVHFVPTPPDTALLKTRAADPRSLSRMIQTTDFPGLVILDTKSDLEALTQNALCAADRILLPISDRAAFEEAARLLSLLDRLRVPRDRTRVVFTLVDRRSRADGGLFRHLEEAVEAEGWPRYRASLSRSPRIEALNSVAVQPGSILQRARGTRIFTEMHALAGEILADCAERESPLANPALKSVLLGG